MNLKHYDGQGHARFVTFCTHRKIPLLTNDLLRRTVIDAIREVQASTGFALLAYVIMPEHVHLVLVPSDDEKLGAIIGEIKRQSSKRIHQQLIDEQSQLLPRFSVRRNGVSRFAFWQRRCYDHNCRTPESVWRKVRYCHDNPVKRGLVRDPGRWLWSSYAWYADDIDSLDRKE
jgi:putative transposase